VNRQKVLVLHKNPKQFKRSAVKRFYLDFLKKYNPNTKDEGWYDLPGGDIRQEHTIEDAITDRLKNDLGIRGVLKHLVGLYDSTKRDPRGNGVTFCFIVKTNDSELTINKNRIDHYKWATKSWFHNNRIYSDHHQMILDYFKGKSITTNHAYEKLNFSSRTLGSYKARDRCSSCGQYRNRPTQVDAILLHKEKVLLTKRSSEKDESEKELKQWYQYGKYSLPGGYVSRNDQRGSCQRS